MAAGPWLLSAMVRFAGTPAVTASMLTPAPGRDVPPLLRMQVDPVTWELADAAAYLDVERVADRRRPAGLWTDPARVGPRGHGWWMVGPGCVTLGPMERWRVGVLRSGAENVAWIDHGERTHWESARDAAVAALNARVLAEVRREFRVQVAENEAYVPRRDH